MTGDGIRVLPRSLWRFLNCVKAANLPTFFDPRLTGEKPLLAAIKDTYVRRAFTYPVANLMKLISSEMASDKWHHTSALLMRRDDLVVRKRCRSGRSHHLLHLRASTRALYAVLM